MRTDFLPQLSRDPLSSLAGGTPWGAIAQTGIGLIQGIAGMIQGGKARRQLERLKSPTYTQSQSIMDFYNKALQRYNVNPTESALYKRQMQNIGRNTAQGISALQDRRGNDITSLIQAKNDATLNAEVAAEGEKTNRFGQLGSATQLKAGEEGKEFEINKMLPYQTKFNLLAAKAGGGTNIANAGLSNIFGGLQGVSDMQMAGMIYGNGRNRSNGLGYQGSGITSEDVFRNRRLFR